MKKLLCLAIALFMLTLTGCGGGGKPAGNGGKVSTDGSTSMEKVIGTLGEAFEQANKGVKFTYNPTGSSAGIQAVSEGRCDLGLSSRKLKLGERQNGLTATILALDGIAIIVNPENKLDDVDKTALAKIYTGETATWANGQPIVVIGREAGSGTRDGFEEIVEVKNKCKYRQELTSTGDVITTVAKNPNAIGYASLAAVKNTVKALKVNGVVPSEATVKNGTYVVQRPFVLVSKGELSATAKKFRDFALSAEAAKLIVKAGAVPMAGGQ